MKKRLLSNLAFCIINIYAFAQSPKFEWRLENEKLISPTTYQLDIYLYNLDTFDFKLGAGTISIVADPIWRNGGTITITTIASELNPSQQLGSAIYTNQSNIFGSIYSDYWRKIITTGQSLTATIIQANKRIKCFTLVFNNTVAFSTSVPPKFAWKFDDSAGAGFNIMDSTGKKQLTYLSYGSNKGANNQKFCYTPSYWNGTQWVSKSQTTCADTVGILDKYHEVNIYNGTYSGSLDIRGYVLMPAATHNMASSDGLTVRANLDNYGTLNSNTASVEFKGNDIAGTERIQYSTAAFTTNNLTQKNPYDVVIGGNTTVNNQLNFSKGNIIVNSNNLIINNNASIVGYSDLGYVVTDTIGCLRINNLGPTGRATAIAFPVGNTGSYNPATITNTGTTDDISVAVAPLVMDTSGVVTSNAVKKTWYINEVLIGGSILNIQLQWNTLNELPSFNRNSCFVTSHDLSLRWTASTPGVAFGSNPFSKNILNYHDLTSKFLFTISSTGITGINKTETMNNLLVYPNPSNGTFTIKFDAKPASNTRISLLNLLGQEVWTESQTLKMGEQELSINTKLSDGVYILRLQNDGEQMVKNIIIKQ
jgi:hypothetical protein